MVVRCAAHRRLSPLVGLGGGLQRSRGDCARDSVGVDRVRALVAKGPGRGATLTRELNLGELRKGEVLRISLPRTPVDKTSAGMSDFVGSPHGIMGTVRKKGRELHRCVSNAAGRSKSRSN